MAARDETRGDEGGVAWASDRERHLGLLAQIAAGRSITFALTAGPGGVRGGSITLPKAMRLGDDQDENERLLVCRALVAGAMVASDPHRSRAESVVARADAEIDRVDRGVDHLVALLPLFAEVWRTACARELETRAPIDPRAGDEQLCVDRLRRAALARFAAGATASRAPPRPSPSARVSAPVALWGIVTDDIVRPSSLRPATEDRATMPTAVSSEAEAPNLGDVREVKLDPRELAESVLQHTFEKIVTADSHNGGARDLDGSDELDEHLEALAEVPLGALIRSEEATASLLWADVDLQSSVPEVAAVAAGERGVPYDEWDARLAAYRRGFCMVYPTTWPRRDPRFAREVLTRRRGLVQKVLDQVVVHRARLAAQRRQPDGECVDIDAVVRHLADVRAGYAGSPRPYIRRARQQHQLATTVLIDMSLSSDAWVENRRVLDVAREAVLVLGEVADRLGDEVQVLGFSSHTRNICRVFVLRDWGESWAIGRARIGAIQPQGFTRIGPAVRHATNEVCRSSARRRIVLLLSDGRPTDYDRYEGAHGVADVRQAVREAHRRSVWVHGLTIDTRARDSFSAMLGAGRWEVLRHVEGLPSALASVWMKAACA